MKLLTLNCHSWQEEDQLEKIRHLAETIKSEDYDVIALQEVSQHRASKDYKDNLKEENFLVVLLKELEKLIAPFSTPSAISFSSSFSFI